jgi:hypothetical protein
MGWNFYNASGELQINDGGVLATAAVITNDLTVNSGNVIIGTAGKGIDFSAQTATSTGTMVSEVFDHYEEGTFTPGLADDTGNPTSESQSYTQALGRYTRIGNRVFFNIKLLMGGLGTMTVGQEALITGLPFTTQDTSNTRNAVSVGLGLNLALPNTSESVTGYIVHNTNYIRLSVWQLTTGTSGMLISEISADGDFVISGQYETAT